MGGRALGRRCLTLQFVAEGIVHDSNIAVAERRELRETGRRKPTV